MECLKLMKQENLTRPYKIHAKKDMFKKRQKVDLVLGENEVLIEIKLELDYSGVNKPVVFSGAVNIYQN